ncbi:MAG: IS1096 element passenger TnpR family protein [Chloroflexia bacterium]
MRSPESHGPGARATPPHWDCSGPADYMELLDALNKPRHRRRLEWLELGFDPEQCDLQRTNWALGRAR